MKDGVTVLVVVVAVLLTALFSPFLIMVLCGALGHSMNLPALFISFHESAIISLLIIVAGALIRIGGKT